MNLAEVLTAIATIGGAVAAWEALKTWKKQLRGSKSHAIAWRYLEAAFKLRNAINYGVRNPWIDWNESQQAAEEFYGKDNVEAARKKNSRADVFAVYAVRWRQVDESRKELRDARVQAEVWWGDKLPDFEKSLFELIGQLYINVKRLIEPDRQLTADDSILYFAKEIETEFDSKLNEAVKDIDDWMRPYVQYEFDEVERTNSFLIPEGSIKPRSPFVPEIFQKPTKH